MKVAFKGKGTLAAAVLTFLMLCLLVLPTAWLTITTADEIKGVVAAYKAGEIAIPPPPEKVKNWPLIGDKAFSLWTKASSHLESLILEFPDQVKSIAGKGVAVLTGTGKAILFVTFAIIISGVFLAYSSHSHDFARAIFSSVCFAAKNLDASSPGRSHHSECGKREFWEFPSFKARWHSPGLLLPAFLMLASGFFSVWFWQSYKWASCRCPSG